MRKPDPGRIAPLARLKVGTKLMLLVLLPVCVLLGFTGFTALADWHAASQLQDFRAATRLSFATAGVAGQLATERTAAAMVRLRPGAQAQAGLGAAQRDVNQALHQAQDRAADWHGSVDVAGRLALARKQLAALRLRAAGGSLSVPDISASYGTRVNDLIGTVGDLIEDRPPQSSGQTPDAYLAMLQAIEAAQRERVDVAAVLGAPRDQTALDQMTATSRWATLEGAELGTFRQNAPGLLAADLDAVLRTPAGIAVRTVRDDILARPRAAVAHTSLGAWLDATGAQAHQTATHAKAAASAYNSAFAAMVPPPVIEANRARRISLASANCLGQTSPTIADIEADYEQMWAHDAEAMYAYARASADASVLTPFNSPPSATGPARSARHGLPSTSGGWALTAAPEVISAGNQLMSTIPEALQALSVSPLTSFDVSLSPVTPALSKLSSLSAPGDVAISRLNSLNKAAVLDRAAALHALIPNVGRANGATSTRGFGRGISIGTLSVPRAWAAATAPPPVTVEPSPSGWVCEPIHLVKGEA